MANPEDLPLAVTMGDPAGCGPQITLRAWQTLSADPASRPFYVTGDPAIYGEASAVIESPADAASVFADKLPVLPLSAALPSFKTGTPDSALAPAIVESIDRAMADTFAGDAGGVVTNPISKAVLYSAGFRHPGHTEYLAELCEAHTGEASPPVMMLVGGGLRVSLATIHVPLMRVLDHLTATSLETVIRTTARAMQRDFGIGSPRIGLTGLNPHAGESGTIGLEERDIINPVADRLRNDGINVSDARPADTIFAETLDGRFDAVIAMTHDQGLIPVKTLDIWGGVNTTLGLPVIRTSPDHGTAYDVAAEDKARPDSLIAAIRLAGQMAAQRARHDA
ncbi:4-hydroxythreonine-4-phosphate dehydrogenase PdxA [Thalassovita mediterranea]|nr:4-hydroxythreonine-4-phosphate dehydrogenase PdxA [Thalassovita mediterranea]